MQRRRRGLHLDGNVRAQAEAAEWLNGSKVVEERRQLDDATAFKGQRQRWSELAANGDDEAVRRADKAVGCTIRRGECGWAGKERAV